MWLKQLSCLWLWIYRDLGKLFSLCVCVSVYLIVCVSEGGSCSLVVCRLAGMQELPGSNPLEANILCSTIIN